jgi:hypothetical protein
MDRLSDIKEKYESLEKKHPYAVTIGEAALAYALKTGAKRVGKKFGVTVGHGRADNPARNDFIEKHPKTAATLATVVAPIGEELLYRHTSNKGLNKLGMEKESTGRHLAELGITALFAAQHVGKDGIPLPQLIGGLNYQRTYNRRGLKHSMLSHITNNSLAVTEAVISKKRGE